MKYFKLDVAFVSDDYSNTPEIVELTITEEEEEKINLARRLVKEHGFSNIRIEFNADKYLDSDGEQSEWEPDVEYLVVYGGSVYFYAQSGGQDQIETSEIEL